MADEAMNGTSFSSFWGVAAVASQGLPRVSLYVSSAWPLVWGAWIVHVAAFLLVATHCLRRRRDTSATLLWLFVAWSFPLLGPLLYVAFGVDRVRVRGFRKHLTERQLLAERKSREDATLPLAYWRAVHDAAQTGGVEGFALDQERAMAGMLPEHSLLGGNRIDLLVDGDEAFPAMLEAIRGATHHVHIQSFIIRGDRAGRAFLDVLAAKAAAGVRVRLLYDRFGSTRAFLSGFFRRYRRVPNLHIVGWTQANPLKRQFQVNLRNHRKILIVDGRLGFCGGINISDANCSNGRRPAIRDYHFAVEGPLVQELQYSFLRDWYFMTEEHPDAILTGDYFPNLPRAGTVPARIVNSGPSSEKEAAWDVFFLSIVNARRQILLVTPYFVPPHDILRALRIAALRGVEVRILVPARSNHPVAAFAGRALYDELLDAGVRIVERRPPFIHAKALLVDDTFALVGTANLDVRSLRLNYETNLAIYGDACINAFKAQVLADFAVGDEIRIEAWRVRPDWQRIAENFSYLLLPVL